MGNQYAIDGQGANQASGSDEKQNNTSRALSNFAWRSL
jgi:hypothetical protein